TEVCRTLRFVDFDTLACKLAQHNCAEECMSINWNANQGYARSIFETIGRTPLVRLNRVATHEQEILVKIEYFSPSGSLKDRIYYNMFTRAEERGDLRAGMTVLECSTGNAGIACSFVSAV